MRSENALTVFLHEIVPLCWSGQWLSMDEMVQLTHLHPSVLRWCMRQLRTGEEGDWLIRKRIREPQYKGVKEFYIKRKPAQTRFDFGGPLEGLARE